LTIALALAVQDALVPPVVLAQIQVQGPLPATPSELPALHRLVVGALLNVWPFADPHAPLTGVGVPPLDELLLLGLELELEFKLLHCAVAPPLTPAQLQLHGPLPLTAEAVPARHRSALDGADESVCPLTVPQVAFTTPVTVTAFWTLRLRVIDCDVPPSWPAGTENTTTVMASVPFGNWVVSTVRL
jgi:hypothetical protein